MATHSSILAWRIPRTEEPGGLDHGVTKSQTQLCDWEHIHINYKLFLYVIVEFLDSFSELSYSVMIQEPVATIAMWVLWFVSVFYCVGSFFPLYFKHLPLTLVLCILYKYIFRKSEEIRNEIFGHF